MKSFKSKQSIINWLNQRKVIKYSFLGFVFFYKIINGKLNVYLRSDKRWIACNHDCLDDFFSDTTHWYKTKQSEIY